MPGRKIYAGALNTKGIGHQAKIRRGLGQRCHNFPCFVRTSAVGNDYQKFIGGGIAENAPDHVENATFLVEARNDDQAVVGVRCCVVQFQGGGPALMPMIGKPLGGPEFP
jgi:hypothetical protein